MTTIDLAAARAALGKITIGDPRITALKNLMPDVRASLKSGASLKQIAGALALSFGGDEKFVLRELAELRRARGGRRKKSTATAPDSAPSADKPARKTLTLTRPTTEA